VWIVGAIDWIQAIDKTWVGKSVAWKVFDISLGI